MPNGKKTFTERYALVAFAIVCTLGSYVLFKTSIYPLAKTTEVTALQTQVSKDTAKTEAVVKQVKQQTSQAAGAAAAAQAAAQQAQKSADVAELAARRHFENEPTKVQIQDLFIRSSHNRADISRMQKQIDDLQKTRR